MSTDSKESPHTPQDFDITGNIAAPVLRDLQHALDEIAGTLSQKEMQDRLETGNWPRLGKQPQDPDLEARATIAMYRQEANEAEAARAARLMGEVARLYEDVLHDPRSALEALQEALGHNPADPTIRRSALRMLADMWNSSPSENLLKLGAEMAEGTVEKLGLLMDLGMYQELCQGQQDKAAGIYRMVLEEDPANLEATEALLFICLRDQNKPEASSLCNHLASSEENPVSRASLLLSAALLIEGLDHERAKLAAQAVEADPSSELALLMAEKLFRQQTNWEAVIRLLEQQTTANPNDAALLHFLISRLITKTSKKSDEAIAQALKACKRRPQEPLFTQWLAELYRKEARWKDYAGALKQQLENGGPDEDQVETHLLLAEILEIRLGQPEAAIEQLEAALAIVPRTLPALQELGRLYMRTQRWEDLLQMHLSEATALTVPTRRAVALYRAGQTCELKLHRREAAIIHLEQAVRLDITFMPAVRLLKDLYRQEQRYSHLVDLYREELKQTPEAEPRVSLLQELATLLDYHLEETEQALAVYQEILDLRPSGHSPLPTMVRLYEKLGHYAPLLETLRQQVDGEENSVQKAALLTKMGQLYEHQLAKPLEALAHYREALELTPQALELYESAGRLLYTNERWHDLVSLYRKQLKETRDLDQKLTLLFRIGRVLEQNLNDPLQAAESYREALKLDPSFRVSARRLIASGYATAEEQQSLKGQLVETTSPGKKRATALIALGLHKEEERDFRAAESFYQQALQEHPQNELARHLLLRAQVFTEQWEKVVEVIHPLAAALISWFSCNDSAKALARLQQEVEHEPTLLLLRWLETLYASQGDRAGQLHALEQRVELELDGDRRTAARFRLAYLAEHGKVPNADPIAICRQILKDSPGDVRALDTLERVARRTQNDELLLEVLARQGEVGPTAETRAVAKAALASVLKRLDRAAEAQEQWHQALQEDPLCRSAYESLKRQYAEQYDTAALLWVLERGLDSIGHPETMIFDLIRRSDLYWEKGDQVHAIADLDRVLELKPDQPNALERIEHILSDRGEWPDLIQRFKKAADTSTSAQSQALICLKLGILYRNDLKDLEQAGQYLSQAVSADPDNVTALLLTADVRLKLDQPTEALALLNRVALRSKQPKELYQAWLGIARISGDILCDPVRAKTNIDMILEREPNHPEALAYMLQLARQLNDLVRQEECLRKLSALSPNPAQRAHLLADLHQVLKQLPSVDEANIFTPLDEALSLSPGKIEWLQPLLNWHTSARRWQESRLLLETNMEALPEDQRPGFQFLLGQILGKHLGLPEEARHVLRQALQADPENDQAVELLLRHMDHEALQDPQWVTEAIRLHRHMLRRQPLLVDSIRALRNLCESAGRIDESYSAESCLIIMEEATEEEVYFHKQRRGQLPLKPTGTLEELHLRNLIALPQGDHPIRQVLLSLRDQLPVLFPADLGVYGIEALTSNTLDQDHPAWDIAASCATVLGVKDFSLVGAMGGAAAGASEPGELPTLVLPRDFLRLPVPEQRFTCGRLLTRVAMGCESLDPGRSDPLTPRALEILLASLQRIEDQGFGEDIAPRTILDDLAQRLKENTPKGELQQAIEAAREAWISSYRDTLASWISTCELGACRGGLICCGNLSSAASFIKRTSGGRLSHDHLQDFVSFTTSEAYAQLRVQLELALH